MLYAIGKNKIVRADNDGVSVAEIHFRETSPKVYEITEVLTAATDDDDKDLDKLMNKMVSHMRKHGNLIYSHDDYALEWIEDHAECHDIWRDSRQRNREKTDSRSSSSRPSADIRDNHNADRSRSSASRNQAQTNPRKPQRSALTAEELPAKGSRKLARVLQYLSALAMLGILICFIIASVLNYASISDSLSNATLGLWILRIGMLLTVLIFLFLSVWILSRRRYLVDDSRTRLDSGRGVFPFTAILLLLILIPSLSSALVAANQAGNSSELFLGINSLLSIFGIYSVEETGLALLGLILSIIRQFTGR